MWRLEIHIYATLKACQFYYAVRVTSSVGGCLFVPLYFGTSLWKKDPGMLGASRTASYLIPNSSSSSLNLYLTNQTTRRTNVKIKLGASDASWTVPDNSQMPNTWHEGTMHPDSAKTRQRWSCQRCVGPWLPRKHSLKRGLSLQRLWKISAFHQS